MLEHRPDWVLNGGAYTAVNGGAPRAFAEALVEKGGRLLQVSTDFVFNGQQGSPYLPEQGRDPPAPTATPRLWPWLWASWPSAPAIPCWRRWDELNRDRAQPSLGC